MTSPTDKNEKILARVQAIIARMEHPNTSEEEREVCRTKADELMFRYAIDEAMIRAAQAAGVREEPRASWVTICHYGSPWRIQLQTLLGLLAETNRCRVVIRQERVVDENRVGRVFLKGHLVGFDADVRFVEMLFTSIHLTFASKIDPKWDPNASEGVNVRRLKEAGWKWEDIARAGEFDWPDNGLLMRIYKRQCKADGVSPIATQRHSAYRAAFADAFFDRLDDRMRESRRARKEQTAAYEQETGATGTALVLANRQTDVDEFFYSLYPNRRPMTDEEYAALRQENEEIAARQAADLQARLDAMTPEERARYDAEQARKERQRQKEYAAWYREQAREADKRYDAAGARAGARAADSVDLTGGKGQVGPHRTREIG